MTKIFQKHIGKMKNINNTKNNIENQRYIKNIKENIWKIVL